MEHTAGPPVHAEGSLPIRPGQNGTTLLIWRKVTIAAIIGRESDI